MNLFTVFIVSLFLTIAVVPVFKRLAFRMNIVDIPDDRKVHVMPMPKTGGISLFLGAFIPMLIWAPKDNFFSSVLIGAIIIFIFGLVDDIKPMNAKQKFLPQTAAALIVILFGGVKITCIGIFAAPACVLPFYLSVPLTLFVILGVTNAINLADGLDGLAGGISMLSFVLIAFLAYKCGNMQISIMAMAMVGAIAGFLRYNTHPAVLFMGDAGSQLLGFLSVVFAIVITQSNAPYSKLMALPIIGFPILDTLAVMAERMLKKKSPFRADKNHFHHRLIDFGFFHSESVLIIYIIQALFIGLALVFRYYSGWIHVGGFLFLSVMILTTVHLGRLKKWEFRRDGCFDTFIKKRLFVLKEKNIFIRICFGCLKYGFPLVLISQVMIPAQIPLYFSGIAFGLILMIGLSCLFLKGKYRETILRFSIYLIIPLLIYMTETDPASWVSGSWHFINNGVFIFLVVFVVMTLNLTRRRQGFKITTMDLLVFIVVLIFPNLPSIHLLEFNAGTTLAKVLVMFFSYDVLAGELRGKSGRIVGFFFVALCLLILRGFL